MTEVAKLTDNLTSVLMPQSQLVFAADSAGSGGTREDSSSSNGASTAAATASTPDVPERYAAYKRLRAQLPDLCSRHLHLVRRARETHPDKVIYNDKTATKIEDLYAQFGAWLDNFYEVNENSDSTSGSDEQNGTSPSSNSNSSSSKKGGNPDDDREAVMANDKEDDDGTAYVPSSTIDVAPKVEAEQLDHHMNTKSFMLKRVEHKGSKEALDTTPLGPIVTRLELDYAAYVIAKANAEAETQRAATDVASHVANESSARELLTMQEVSDWATLLTEARASAWDARVRREQREQALWEAELSRRRAEQATLQQKLTAGAGNGGGLDAAFSNALRKLRSDHQLCPPETFRSLRSHLVELLTEIMNHPENEGIRAIRTNSVTATANFGNPCIEVTAPFYEHCELLLCSCGYAVSYSRQATHTAVLLQRALQNHSIKLPAQPSSSSLSPLSYTPLGFERYGERALVLREPDANVDSDAWMNWFGRISAKLDELRAS